jgi:hypothetical protein
MSLRFNVMRVTHKAAGEATTSSETRSSRFDIAEQSLWTSAPSMLDSLDCGGVRGVVPSVLSSNCAGGF